MSFVAATSCAANAANLRCYGRMQPPRIAFQDLGKEVLAFTYSGVTGEGQVSPRLVVTLLPSVPPDPLTPLGREVQIRRLRITVICGTEHIGWGEAGVLATTWSLHNKNQLQVTVPLSLAAIHHVEKTNRGHEVNLTLHLQAAFRYRFGVAYGEDPQEWLEDIVHEGMSMAISIPRSTWVHDVLQPIGTDRYIFLEARVPPLPAGGKWDAAQQHLHSAETRNQEGYDPDVLRHAWDSFEALSPGAGNKILGGIINDAKREHFNKVLLAFRGFLQHGRHPRERGEELGLYDVDHRDAAMAIAVTKALLAYIAARESEQS